MRGVKRKSDHKWKKAAAFFALLLILLLFLNSVRKVYQKKENAEKALVQMQEEVKNLSEKQKNLTDSLYSFIANPGSINQISLGIFNLAQPNYVLAVLAGLAQFWQAKTLSRKNPPTQAGEGSKDEAMLSMMNKQMLYFMPVMTVLIGLNLPAGLTLYWFFGTVLMVLQQIWLSRAVKNDGNNNVIEGQIVK
jgi:uncharacterized membrane protein